MFFSETALNHKSYNCDNLFITGKRCLVREHDNVSMELQWSKEQMEVLLFTTFQPHFLD